MAIEFVVAKDIKPCDQKKFTIEAPSPGGTVYIMNGKWSTDMKVWKQLPKIEVKP